ncbi:MULTISPECIES: hypothetical protein [Thermomonosporaceae]|uniref:hypothetical protein n=1 Tax=Thermomonosporaceae TaxID=2012 RepID=UPI00255A7745|nr:MULTISPECIES: hypothetical protein [Thermomonosporaceae]MDL4771990.1 hypothetical protein [Actinomadura xylanilytica]
MGAHNKETFSFAELDLLAGEILPERVLLSLAGPPTGDGHRTEVFYACQSTYYAGTSGLLGTGLLAEGAKTTMTCVPAVTNSY